MGGMSRSADSASGKRAAEVKFPHRIDIPIPVGGLGNRLTEMLMWCRQNVGAVPVKHIFVETQLPWYRYEDGLERMRSDEMPGGRRLTGFRPVTRVA